MVYGRCDRVRLILALFITFYSLTMVVTPFVGEIRCFSNEMVLTGEAAALTPSSYIHTHHRSPLHQSHTVTLNALTHLGLLTTCKCMYMHSHVHTGLQHVCMHTCLYSRYITGHTDPRERGEILDYRRCRNSSTRNEQSIH